MFHQFHYIVLCGDQIIFKEICCYYSGDVYCQDGLNITILTNLTQCFPLQCIAFQCKIIDFDENNHGTSVSISGKYGQNMYVSN